MWPIVLKRAFGEPIVVLPAEEPTTTDADDEEDNVVDVLNADNDKDAAVLDAASH